MTIPITGSTLTCLLSAALVIQLVVLATRFAAWQRYRKWQTTGEMPGDDPRLVPQTSLQAWLPVLSSGYGALVMAGLAWIAAAVAVGLRFILGQPRKNLNVVLHRFQRRKNRRQFLQWPFVRQIPIFLDHAVGHIQKRHPHGRGRLFQP